ncbi:MAG: zinc ABC transporter substrate-binding protein [Lentisphaeria bacterium]|nr:zinc ABC transporter substrate-binding protein [Lentisphaeria bacterium]
MKKIFCIFVFFFAVIQVFAAVEVTVGIAPEKFIIDRIGGAKVKVKTVMPTGKNVHDFAITPDMVKNITAGKVFFHTGLLFEQRIANILSNRKVRVVNLAEYINKIQEVHPLHNSSEHPSDDVHTWFSYRNLKMMAMEAEKILCEIDKENADFYTLNCEKLCMEIDNAKASAVKKLSHWQGKTFLTHHAAFGYFADEFKLKQLSFEFNGREITPANLTYLSRYAKQHKIKRVFVQSTASPNVRRAIQQTVKAKLVTIDPADYNILKNLNRFSTELEAAFE